MRRLSHIFIQSIYSAEEKQKQLEKYKFKYLNENL